jgi:quercetin dioxygenase-like cupin family protein
MTQPIILHAEEGEAIWSLNHLMTVKATGAETGGAFGLMEHLGSPGTGAPPHVHHGEDEFFFILEGEANFLFDGKPIAGKPGTFLFLPRDIEHGFEVVGTTPCRMLVGFTPAGLENFFAEMGEPAASRTPPAPAPPDMEKLFAQAAKYNYEIHPPAHA